MTPTVALHIAAQGWVLALGLIVAIGAHNAFVLRQGLRREHVAPIVLLCAATDAALMGVGVFGMAGLMRAAPGLTQALAVLGVLLLAGYAIRSWRAALASHRLAPGQQPALSRRAALLQAAAFTYLNPHVHLDTVLLVGTVGAQQGGAAARLAIWLGRPRPAPCGSRRGAGVRRSLRPGWRGLWSGACGTSSLAARWR